MRGVSRMRRAIGLMVCVLVAGACCAIYALFHGYFDHSQYQIKQVQWSPQKKVAVVVRRSDNQALNGDEYFLLLGDRVFALEEAKHAYYGKQAVFGTNQDCLAIRWSDASELLVTCNGHSIGSDQIDVKKDHVGNVRIIYENISPK